MYGWPKQKKKYFPYENMPGNLYPTMIICKLLIAFSLIPSALGAVALFIVISHAISREIKVKKRRTLHQWWVSRELGGRDIYYHLNYCFMGKVDYIYCNP